MSRFGAMSLNRSEQTVYDYLQAQPDELRFWQGKVQALARREVDEHLAAATLARDLWDYYEERSAVAQPFKEIVAREGVQRTSMRNLAELLLRLWVEPRPKRKTNAMDLPALE
jgi:hypothetical protein